VIKAHLKDWATMVLVFGGLLAIFALYLFSVNVDEVTRVWPRVGRFGSGILFAGVTVWLGALALGGVLEAVSWFRALFQGGGETRKALETLAGYILMILGLWAVIKISEWATWRGDAVLIIFLLMWIFHLKDQIAALTRAKD
jgi:hypothetical protein